MNQSDSPRRAILLLLVTLLPLLFAMRWVATKFPTSVLDAWTYAGHVEPGKLAYFIETYDSWRRYSYIRVFSIDLEKESMEEIVCPSNVVPMWHDAVGIDIHGNVICRTRSDRGYEYYCCNPRSGEARLISSTDFTDTVLIGQRFLSRANEMYAFAWHDLDEPGSPPHQKQQDNPIGNHLVPIPKSNSFYWIDNEVPQPSQPVEEDETIAETTEVSDSVLLEMLESEDIGPPTQYPDETLVLMGMTPEGPYEIARWPVIGGSGNATCYVGDGCIGCFSLDGRFINIHDALTGRIRLQINVPQTAINSGWRNLKWRTYGSFITLDDGAGGYISINSDTGASYDTSNSFYGLVMGVHDEEYWTLLLKTPPDSWPGFLEGRSSQSGQVLHSWKVPDHLIAFGWTPMGNIQHTPDGHEIIFITQDGRVLYVNKSSGKISRVIWPRFWIPIIAAVVGMFAVAWAVCWIRFSARIGIPYWLDLAVILTISYLFLWWRITLAGCHEDYDRIAWKCATALHIASGTLVVHQTLYTKHSAFFKVLPSFIFVAVSFLAIRLQAEQGWMVNAITTYTILVSLVVLVGSILTHRICPPFSPAKSQFPRKESDFKFSLRHLFFITFLCAAITESLRLIEWRWALEIVWRNGFAFGLVGGIALLMHCAVLCRGLIWLKSTVAIALIASVAISWCYRQMWWDFAIFESVAKWSEFTALLGFATILVASPIRLRQSLQWTLEGNQNGS
ncbi:hypothetical protein VN12_25245 [Pirellula sp. SH-Sr6A]|uniref:hypothetical protein n=1 Tax=Pirellula sp. SH-Sr6A TaxID=1632865 RepID=UPI00078BF53A|nr:hypothetical protein [Pirellula sp. SH-Sr6A]AMV35421.1 hypothetical protein VN12_25245 [Pirellula sp. SH-Sr6A]